MDEELIKKYEGYDLYVVVKKDGTVYTVRRSSASPDELKTILAKAKPSVETDDSLLSFDTYFVLLVSLSSNSVVIKGVDIKQDVLKAIYLLNKMRSALSKPDSVKEYVI